jgi:hypothetical protein
MSAGPQDGLRRLEALGAITAESDRRLRKVEQVRVHVQRELAGAEVQQKLSGHDVLIRRPVLGERLHPRLDAPQTPDGGERPGNGATLRSVELAGRRASLGVPAVAVAARCPLLSPQPAAAKPSTATASARAPIADVVSPAADKGNRDILTELPRGPRRGSGSRATRGST